MNENWLVRHYKNMKNQQSRPLQTNILLRQGNNVEVFIYCLVCLILRMSGDLEVKACYLEV